MENNKASYESIDEYIAQFPDEVQRILQELRRVIREAAPNAKEKMSYQMPTFALHGNLVHFAAYKNHVGFYPDPAGVEAFRDKLAGYKMTKGAIQFPIDKPLPYDLIAEMVEFRVAENIKKAEDKRRKTNF